MAKAQEFTQTPKTPPLELDARSQQSVRSKAPSRLDVRIAYQLSFRLIHFIIT